MPSRNSSQVLSEEIAEFISRRPHWVINWGSSILLSLVLLGLLGAWMIDYPDTVMLPAHLKAVRSPVAVTIPADGRLINLCVSENATVQKGQLLAEMGSKTPVIMAPQTGRIAFTTPVNQGQFLQAGQRLCFIIPEHNLFYANIMVPAKDYEKIAIDQTVLLKLGAASGHRSIVKGKISAIPLYPADSNYQVTVKVLDPLSASLQRKIELQEYSIQAEIIIKEMRLLERLYINLIKW